MGNPVGVLARPGTMHQGHGQRPRESVRNPHLHRRLLSSQDDRLDANFWIDLTMAHDTNVTWHEHQVTRERREALITAAVTGKIDLRPAA